MKTLTHFSQAVLCALLLQQALPASAQVPLADKPVFSVVSVPGNLALALSVEFPTVVSVAHLDSTYVQTKEYLGYFDPNKCYLYKYFAVENAAIGNLSHFYPVAVTPDHKCTSQWSGNFLNWVVTPTIDPFRWALTGGYRAYDTAGTVATPGVTLLEKAWSANGQTGTGRFPNRGLGTAAEVSSSTPVGGSSLSLRLHDLGNKMVVTRTGDVEAGGATPYDPGAGLTFGSDATVYEFTVRVKVCDASIGLESNCVAYTNATYKPEGLMQKYATRIRYSAFGYLNDDDINRDAGVLRARMAYVGPIQPVPLFPSIPNSYPEWSGVTGVMKIDPLKPSSCETGPPCPVIPDDAAVTAAEFGVTVTNSGVMNYLNKFGQITPGSFKTYDPVGELYYAATRYFKNLGNVPQWTNMTSASLAQKTKYVDGFPVITTWDDPILYSCQKNFILGIGDVNSHADKNVPGSSITGAGNEPTTPASLSTDPVNASLMTNKVGDIQGGLGASLGSTNPYNGCCNNNSALMAGIAYDSNTRDIRPTVVGKPQSVGMQTIQTYWLDVLEYSAYKNTNQFYLAAKFGAFEVPTGFNPDSATALPSESSWYTTTRVSSSGQKLPDSYFVAAKPDELVAGLKSAFEKIAEKIEATTTGVSTALPQVQASGNASFSASYSAKDWTSEIIATTRVFAPPCAPSPPAPPGCVPPPTPIEHWKFSEKLDAQLTGSGWSTPAGRRMATWDGSGGIPFRLSNLTAAGYAGLGKPLDTPWLPGDDSADFLNYLRGDRSKEVTTPKYRTRTKLVNDIVGSRLTTVGRPAASFDQSDTNPGYKAFKDTWVARRKMLYVGTNGGVVHAINGAEYVTAPSPLVAGSEVDPNAGAEVFAYVPSALFNGPSSPSTPDVDGLAALGNPSYLHRYFVNATPLAFDIDLMNTQQGKTGTLSCRKAAADTSPNWRTLLIGGLGKGGKSYYALDVTDPMGITNETILASNVRWEFPRASDVALYSLGSKMGYSYGEPIVFKTEQHGWVVAFTSGYNNTDGHGYIFIVDPCTGLMVQPPIPTKIGGTPVGTPALEAGLAHATAYVLSFKDGTADAIYAGDYLGNLWRVDVTAATGDFPDAQRIAVFTDAAAKTQSVTVRPMVEYDPKTLKRFVMVGTGRLLDKTDTGDLQKQNFYAIKDGDKAAFDTALNSSSTLVRSNLVDITGSLTTGSVGLSNQKGWYINVGDGFAGVGWRVVTKSDSFFGTILFAATLPDSSDECAATGKSLIYAVGFGSGESLLRDSSGATLANLELPYTLTDLSFFTDGNGSSKIVVGGDKGQIEFPPTAPLTAPSLRRLNWREIQIAE